MTKSSFESAAGTQDDVATPYGVDGNELPLYQFAAKAAGGLYTTAPDLARFVAASIAGGSGTPIGRGVLEPSTVETMQTSAPDASVTMGPLSIGYYGLGYLLEPVLWVAVGLSSDTTGAIKVGSQASWRHRTTVRTSSFSVTRKPARVSLRK